MSMKILLFIGVCVSAGNVFADEIKCEFKDYQLSNVDPIIFYTCMITSIKRDNNQNVFDENHSIGQSDNDVTAMIHSYKDGPLNLTNYDSSFCQKYPNLEKIDLVSIKLDILHENAIFNCRNLQYFELFDANVRQIQENFFSKSEKLVEVSFWKNQLQTLPENIFANLKELRELLLNENQLNFLSSNIFKALTRLSLLRLDDNHISTLNPAWFETLGNLELLNLCCNQIKHLPRDIFAPLEYLKQLLLEKNQLTTVHGDSFGFKKYFIEINLSDNRINAVDENFINNTAIKYIYMESNICSHRNITTRDSIKPNLQVCFDNYEPRQQQASSSTTFSTAKEFQVTIATSLMAIKLWHTAFLA